MGQKRDMRLLSISCLRKRRVPSVLSQETLLGIPQSQLGGEMACFVLCNSRTNWTMGPGLLRTEVMGTQLA